MKPGNNTAEPADCRTGRIFALILFVLAGHTIDITARKQAEAAVQRKAEALRASNDEMDHFNRAMVGRELRMIELKQEINELCHRLGEPPRHVTPPGGGGA